MFSIYKTMGRKPLILADNDFQTAEDVLEYQKMVKVEWANSNPDKVYQYNRKKCLQRCSERVSIPTINTVRKYKFTKDELEPIFSNLLNKIITESNKVSSPDQSDTEGNCYTE